MGGPNKLSYIGSTIHLFQNYKFACESRVKQHFTHAENHREVKPHTCRQPLLYGAMGMNLHLWYTLPISNIKNARDHSKKPTVLRKIELNFIKATNPPLNVVGLKKVVLHRGAYHSSVKIKPRASSTKLRMPKKLGSFSYPKIDGSITWFGSITDKRWYNLVALIRHVMKSNQKTSGHVIKGFYGSKLTDLTNYTKLKCTLGCITVGYSNIETNLWNAIKIIKHKKGAFQFVILSFYGVVYFERKWKYFESFGKFSKEDLKNLSLQKLLNI